MPASIVVRLLASLLAGLLVGAGLAASLHAPVAQSSGTSSGSSSAGGSGGSSGAGGSSGPGGSGDSGTSGGSGGSGGSSGAGVSGDSGTSGASSGTSGGDGDVSTDAGQVGGSPAVERGIDVDAPPPPRPVDLSVPTAPPAPFDVDGDGLVDGTSGFVPAIVLPPAAVAITFAAVPLYVADCIVRVVTGTYRDTRDLCPDVFFARGPVTGTSVTPAPTRVEQVDIFVEVTVEGDRFFVVPKVPVQRPLATIAMLVVALTFTVVVAVVARELRRGRGGGAVDG